MWNWLHHPNTKRATTIESVGALIMMCGGFIGSIAGWVSDLSWAGILMIALATAIGIPAALILSAVGAERWGWKKTSSVAVNSKEAEIKGKQTFKTFSYPDPPDHQRVMINWKAPITSPHMHVAIDFAQVGSRGHTRMHLGHIDAVLESQDNKTIVCSCNENGFWVWGQLEQLMPHKATSCRLTIADDQGTEWHWRFAFPKRDGPERPQITGEDLFLKEFG